MAFGFAMIFILSALFTQLIAFLFLILFNFKNYLTQNQDYNQLNSRSIKNFELTNRAFEALIDEFFKIYNEFL